MPSVPFVGLVGTGVNAATATVCQTALSSRASASLCAPLLHKVAQFHHLIEEVLEVFIGDFALEGGNESFGFFVRIGTQGA